MEQVNQLAWPVNDYNIDSILAVSSNEIQHKRKVGIPRSANGWLEVVLGCGKGVVVNFHVERRIADHISAP